jgi:threonine dehydrogenase-like Zn-dependent dehydrogenase
MTHFAVTITAKEKAELLPVAFPGSLKPSDVRGSTIVSLISPGTEINANYLGSSFPSCPGYAAVFRVEEKGKEVQGIKNGDVVFAMRNHRSFQQCDARVVLSVPEGLGPERAVIARLMGITMTTLMTTAARPGDVVLVTGAGPVGFLGAHIFRNAGYQVSVVEPDDTRREIVRRSGIEAVYADVPTDSPVLLDKVALALECSGHEQAVLDACRVVWKGGEVVLVGIPWRSRTDRNVRALLWEIFHRYIVLRSGWEWELPRQTSSFRPHSIFANFRLAMQWLDEGRIPLEGLISLHSPKNAQTVYQQLLHGQAKGLFQVFDWA